VQAVGDLSRFIQAQESVYLQALAEIRSGRKSSHWMWYVFPQLAGLGHSPIAQQNAINNVDEAAAYLAHPVLGARLVEITNALLIQPSRDPSAIFGYPDDLKLCSCMTLFARVPGSSGVFNRVIDELFAGQPDQATLQLLGQDGGGMA